MKFLKYRASRFNPIVTLIIIASWLVLLGLLFRDQYFAVASNQNLESFQFCAAESDDWFTIKIGGAYAGYGRSRQFQQGSQWKIRDDLNISLNLQGQIKPIKIANESVVDENFRLVSFHLKVVSGIITFEQRGRMEGRDLVVDIPQKQGGGVKKLKLYEAPMISRSLGLPVPLAGLKIGDEIHLPVFDPLDGNKWEAVIRVLEQADLEISGQKIPAWRVRAIFRSLELVMWIDEQGRLLKGRMPLDMTVTRCDKAEIAREMRSTIRDLPEITELTSVPVEGHFPEIDAINSIKFGIEGDGDFLIPSDEFRQNVQKSEISIKKENIPTAQYSLPSIDPKMQHFLGSSRFIRSDNAEIVRKAKEIVGDEANPVKAALLINGFVHSYLKKVPTPGVPDAYSTLLSKQGDCNEHAILAVSLARAVGLPARIAVGLVHTDSGFAYHAWVNYWAGETWFSADPLVNKVPVSPLYITLIYGDVDKHVNVLSFLGRLKLKILETG